MRKIVKTGILLGISGYALVVGSGAIAQNQIPGPTSPTEPSPVDIESPSPNSTVANVAPDTTEGDQGEIIVTANRREENIQKVPLSVSVLQSKTLDAAGVSSPVQLQQVSTNVQIGVLNAIPLIYIRGMGTSQLVAGTEGPVGLYQDGVYVPYTMSFNQNFIDVQRVEVLKGPQGTLYGRNTTAGAVNIITRDPSAARTVEGRVSIGSYGNRQVQAYVSTGPGRLAGSLAASYNRHDYFMKNEAHVRDTDNRKEFAIRGKVKLEINDDWTATASAGYYKSKDFNQFGFISYNDYPTARALGGCYGTMKDPRHFCADYPTLPTRVKEIDASLNVRGDIGFADIVSITGYRHHRHYQTADNDASDLPISHFSAKVPLDNFSQELQIVSHPGSRLEYIAGLYYFQSKGGFDIIEVFFPGNTNGPVCCSTSKIEDQSKSDLFVYGLGKAKAVAAYGQVSYKLTDELKFTVGARYSHEKRTLLDSAIGIPGVGKIPVDPRQSATSHSFDPKFGIDYSWGRNLLYATFTRGFKSGGFNLGSPGSAGPVDPEKVGAFEIGGKHTLVSGVNFNWAMFRYKYKDLQVSIVQNSGNGSLFNTENAASANIKGAEADIFVTAIPRVNLRAGIGYTDAKYGKFEGASAYLECRGLQPGDPNLALCPNPGFGYFQTDVDLSGRPLNRAPKVTATGQVAYTLPIGSNNLDLTGNVFYTGSYYLDTASDVHQNRFAIVNLRANFRFLDDRMSLGLFVNNLTKKRYVQAHSTTAAVIAITPSDPRIIGGTLAFRF